MGRTAVHPASAMMAGDQRRRVWGLWIA